MATSKISSKSPTIRRILKEASEISSAPSPEYTATPLESDLFEWHFTLRGPPNSAYANGIYHGRIVLPPTYPLRPPSFRFTTPSGRFEANREICLSISGHHEETWQPAWGVRTALVALRSFMETDARGQLGGLETSESVRRRLADESRSWRCSGCGGRTNEEVIKECEERYAEWEKENQPAGADGGEGSARNEVEVPSELRMGFRDQMEGSAEAARKEDQEAAELAEGFVQTAPMPQAAEPVPATSSLPARPAQGVPVPTATVPLPDPLAQGVQQQEQQVLRRGNANNGVPVWVDYAIMTLVGLLLAMIFKVFLGH